MVLDFMFQLQKFLKGLEVWFYENYGNPFLWMGLIGLIIAFMGAGYSSLHKGE